MSREKQLSCLIYTQQQGEQELRRVTIDKKDGGSRTLLVPCSLLKGVQRNILHHVLDERPVSPCAQAYRKGTDIRGNASCHLGKKLVLKLDISHFFDSILFPRVISAAFPGYVVSSGRCRASGKSVLLPGTPAPGLSGFPGHLQSGDAPL